MQNLSDKSVKDKIEKLVTAIFMVTDYMDAREPIRAKLRSMCLEMLSSAHALNHARTIVAKNEIIALVNVAKSIGLVSEMNSTILLRELNRSRDFIEQNFMINLERLEMGEIISPTQESERAQLSSKGELNQGGEQIQNPRLKRGGVAEGRGGDLLTDIDNLLDKVSKRPTQNDTRLNDTVGQVRKQSILNTIKIKKLATINDIKMSIKDVSEKTIQRDLLSLMGDGLIKKEGEKRWSRYSVK